MGKVQELMPRDSQPDRGASDYISNAQRELNMVRGAVRVALLMRYRERRTGRCGRLQFSGPY